MRRTLTRCGSWPFLISIWAALMGPLWSQEGTWQELNPRPVPWTLHDLFFLDDHHGWAVGTEGVIRTTDGGTTWEAATGRGGGFTIWFFDTEHGLSAHDWDLWGTSDGGATWRLVNDEMPYEPQSLFFHDRDRGWLISFQDGLWRTLDGGETWERVEDEQFAHLPQPGTRGRTMDTGRFSCCYWIHFRDLFFRDEQEGWAVGGYKSDDGSTSPPRHGMIFKTTDGGDSWVRASSQLMYHTPIFAGVFALRDGPAYAVGGEETILREQSNTWYKKYEASAYHPLAYRWRTFGQHDLVLNDVLFLDEQTGWAVGDQIVHTSNGNTWDIERPVQEEEDVWLTKVARAGNRLVAVGEKGLILHRSLLPESADSMDVEIEERPDPPDSIWVEHRFETTVILHWESVAGVDGYHVYRQPVDRQGEDLSWEHEDLSWEHIEYVPNTGLTTASHWVDLPPAKDFWVAVVSVLTKDGKQVESGREAIHVPKVGYADFIGDGTAEALTLRDIPVQEGSGVAYSPDGFLLAVGSGRGIELYDSFGTEVSHLAGGRCDTPPVFFFEGRSVLCGGDTTVRLWEVSSGALRTFEGHRYNVRSVQVSPDGSIVASEDMGEIIRLWDASNGTPLATLEGQAGHGDGALVFSPDGKILAYGDGRKIPLWDTSNWERIATLEGHANSVSFLAFSPQGTVLASGSWDNTVRLWDVFSQTVLDTLEGHDGMDGSLAFSPDGKILANGDVNTVRLWDVFSGTLLAYHKGHEWNLGPVVFSPDGKILASGADRRIALWDVSGEKLLASFRAHEFRIHSLSFSPDGRTLTSIGDYKGGGWYSRVRMWDMESYITFPPTAVQSSQGPSPGREQTVLQANYPNPFNRATQVPYRLADPGRVRLTIYNVLGQPVYNLIDEFQAAGPYQVQWNGRDRQGAQVAAGVYVAHLRYPGGVQTRRLLYLK